MALFRNGIRISKPIKYDDAAHQEAKDLITESSLLSDHHGHPHWSKSMIDKYLRPYSLGAGATQYGHAKHRYHQTDVNKAWSDAMEDFANWSKATWTRLDLLHSENCVKVPAAAITFALETDNGFFECFKS